MRAPGRLSGLQLLDEGSLLSDRGRLDAHEFFQLCKATTQSVYGVTLSVSRIDVRLASHHLNDYLFNRFFLLGLLPRKLNLSWQG